MQQQKAWQVRRRLHVGSEGREGSAAADRPGRRRRPRLIKRSHSRWLVCVRIATAAAAAVSLITRESVRVYYVCGVISCWSTVVSCSRPAPRTTTTNNNIVAFRQSFVFVHLFRVCPVPIFRPRSVGDVFPHVPFSSRNVAGVILLLLLALFFKRFLPPTIAVHPSGL